MHSDTIPRPMGGELYQEILDGQGKPIALSYNDLWTIIVCKSALNGDWARAREAAGLAPDPMHKRAIVERLSRLDAEGLLPVIPEMVVRMNAHRAQDWFNHRTVSNAKSW